MKIIDKVLKEHEGIDKKDVKFKCPSHYGFEQPTFKECRKMSCEECWSREVEEEPVEEVSDVLYPTTRNLQLRLCNTHIVPMSKKACEESAEVLEAAVMYQLEPTEENAHALAQENIDAIQMHLNMLNYLEKQGVITIPLEIKDHNRKIYLRGWEVDTSLKLEAKEG